METHPYLKAAAFLLAAGVLYVVAGALSQKAVDAWRAGQ